MTLNSNDSGGGIKEEENSKEHYINIILFFFLTFTCIIFSKLPTTQPCLDLFSQLKWQGVFHKEELNDLNPKWSFSQINEWI